MQSKIIGFLIKKGNKKKALKLFNNLLNSFISNTYKISTIYLFSILFFKLNTNIELREFKFRKRVHYIPMPIKRKRKMFIIIKWLKQAILLNKLKVNVATKLYEELANTLFAEQFSNIINYKVENEKKAFQYKAKAHFRWS